MPDDIPAVPLHFLPDEADEPQPAQQEIETDEIDDIHTQNVDKVVLPSEARMLQHFCKLYIEFNEALNEHIPTEPFTTDQRIALYTLYSSQWGQRQ